MIRRWLGSAAIALALLLTTASAVPLAAAAPVDASIPASVPETKSLFEPRSDPRFSYCTFEKPRLRTLRAYFEGPGGSITEADSAFECIGEWVRFDQVDAGEAVDFAKWILRRWTDDPGPWAQLLQMLDHYWYYFPRAAELAAELRAMENRLKRPNGDYAIGQLKLLTEIERRIRTGYQYEYPVRYARNEGGTYRAQIYRPLELPGIVPIGSSYVDEGTRTRRVSTEVGTGNVVDTVGGGRFLVTAAHLVRGEAPFVQLDGKRVPIDRDAQVLADNEKDVAIVALAGAGGPAALLYSPGDHRLYRSPQLLAADRGLTLPLLQVSQPDYAKFGDDRITRYIPISPWAKSGVDALRTRFYSEGPERVRGIGPAADGEQIRVDFRSTPGTSGSILLTDQARAPIEGILTESNNYFHETRFAAAAPVGDLIERFRAGERGNATPDIEWRLRNGLAYRTFGDGIEDTSFTRSASGGVLIENGGSYSPPGGSYSPPGGSYSPPGGSYSPPGGSYSPPGGGDCGSRVTGYPLDERVLQGLTAPVTGLDVDTSPRELFEHYAIEPGIRWNRRSVLGIRAIPLRPELGAEFTMYADTDAIRFMRRHRADYRFEPLERGGDLIAPLLRKLGVAPGAAPAGGFPIRLRATQGPPQLGPRATKAHVPFELDSEAHEILVHRDRVEIRVRAPARFDLQERYYVPDSIRLEIGRDGTAGGSRGFLPVAEVRGGDTGERYHVDLRSLLFSESPAAPGTLPRAGITVRNVLSGQEVMFRFEPVAR